MRIAIISQTFSPEIGGVATISRVIAEEFCRQGHFVEVFTRTRWPHGSRQDSPAYGVHRRPRLSESIAPLRKCDLLIQNHVSLWGIAADLLSRKPCIVWLQAPLTANGSLWHRLVLGLFRLYVRFSPRVLAISRTAAGDRPVGITGNPYNDTLFRTGTEERRRYSVLFCGRLSRIKGLPVLLEALVSLKIQFPDAKLTVLGSGPDEAKCRRICSELGLDERVSFLGDATPEQTAEHMRRHEILAVPSIWEEPFGVVALEGIASGCYVIAFPKGGLPDAVGQAGLLCPDATSDSLAAGIARIWTDPDLRTRIDSTRDTHLQSFRPSQIVRRLIEAMGPTGTMA